MTAQHADSGAARKRGAAVLAEHDDEPGWTVDEFDRPVYECQCGDRSPALMKDWIGPEDVEAAAKWWRLHVAAALADAGLLAHQGPDQPDEVGCGYCGESLTAHYTGKAAYHLPCAARVYGDSFDVGGDR